jgi:small subunit ribosomal protein S14
MAKKSNVVNLLKKQKFSTREKNRCNICGRPKSYMRKFGICRICFRELAQKGELPGVLRASW